MGIAYREVLDFHGNLLAGHALFEQAGCGQEGAY